MNERYRQLLSALGEENTETLRRFELEKRNKRRREKVAARRREIIAVMKDHPAIRSEDLAERFGVTTRTIERDRRALRELLTRCKVCPVCGQMCDS